MPAGSTCGCTAALSGSCATPMHRTSRGLGRHVEFAPTVVADLGEVVAGAVADGGDGIVKITGVSDDHDLVSRTEASARVSLGAEVSAARSQDYYLDVTHPAANKGGVVEHLSALYGIAPVIAVLGDMPNDVLMFAKGRSEHRGTGNADREVQRVARHVAPGNDHDGFAEAAHRSTSQCAAMTATNADTDDTGRQNRPGGTQRHG